MTLTLVIFGATGDLTARKLAPSLYRLASKGRLPEDVKIVGAARTPLSDDAFRDRWLGRHCASSPKTTWTRRNGRRSPNDSSTSPATPPSRAAWTI